mmetsp:Transcript_82585/g.184185  ORF Transcript_82585/g.184185 Transcript_82585/m.184185 type:complete len:80 (+) Transcript_82585:3-242(+)
MASLGSAASVGIGSPGRPERRSEGLSISSPGAATIAGTTSLPRGGGVAAHKKRAGGGSLVDPHVRKARQRGTNPFQLSG